MKLKDILDNTDAPIFVRVKVLTLGTIKLKKHQLAHPSLKNAVETQETQELRTSQTVGLLSETVFANDVVFDHNISYPEYYRPYREYSVDVITVDNYITDKITESNIPYLDVTVSRSAQLSNLLDKDGKPAPIDLRIGGL